MRSLVPTLTLHSYYGGQVALSYESSVIVPHCYWPSGLKHLPQCWLSQGGIQWYNHSLLTAQSTVIASYSVLSESLNILSSYDLWIPEKSPRTSSVSRFSKQTLPPLIPNHALDKRLHEVVIVAMHRQWLSYVASIHIPVPDKKYHYILRIHMCQRELSVLELTSVTVSIHQSCADTVHPTATEHLFLAALSMGLLS